MTILALDLATILGFAIRRADGCVESGEVNFSPRPHEGDGARFLRYHHWLREIRTRFPDLKRIAFEKVVGVGIGQAYAAQVHGGYLALTYIFADSLQIEAEGYNVTTVKMRFAGAGNAKKEDMVARCRALGYKVHGHNEADAIAVLHVATDSCPPLPPRAPKPKKRAKADIPFEPSF